MASPCIKLEPSRSWRGGKKVSENLSLYSERAYNMTRQHINYIHRIEFDGPEFSDTWLYSEALKEALRKSYMNQTAKEVNRAFPPFKKITDVIFTDKSFILEFRGSK